MRSFAPDAVTRTLALTQNGRTVAEQTVEVPAGGRAQATFAALELASGANRVEVALEPADDLTRRRSPLSLRSSARSRARC